MTIASQNSIGPSVLQCYTGDNCSNNSLWLYGAMESSLLYVMFNIGINQCYRHLDGSNYINFVMSDLATKSHYVW